MFTLPPAPLVRASGLAAARRFFRREEGATAVEFAFLAPIFLAVSFMFVQLGLYEMQTAGLSFATQKAARQIYLGNFANSGATTLPNFINNVLCPALPPPMSCDRLVVNATKIDPAGTAAQTPGWGLTSASGLAPIPLDNTKTTFCIGAGGSTVALQIYYAMPAWMFPMFNASAVNFKGSPAIWIASTAAFRNEPFTTAYTGC